MENPLFVNYLLAMDAGNSAASRWLLENKNAIVGSLGRGVFNEFVLNYRSHYTAHRKHKLLEDFKRLILPKQKEHTSDIAIAYNLITYAQRPLAEQEMLIEFMYKRVSPKLPKVVASTSYAIKRHFVLEHVQQMLDSRKTLRR